MNTLLNKTIGQCAMDADFDDHFEHRHLTINEQKIMHKALLRSVRIIKEEKIMAKDHFPHHDHPGHHLPQGGFIRQVEHPHHPATPAVHYHQGPEHHHYHAPPLTHTTPDHGHFPHFESRHTEYVRHHVTPHWNVGRGERQWQADRTPWKDEVGVWHQDHRIFVDDSGMWWDDFGRWRDTEGFWHMPETLGDLEPAIVPPPPYSHPFDNVLNQIIGQAADYVAEKAAEEVVKKESKEGEKND